MERKNIFIISLFLFGCATATIPPGKESEYAKIVLDSRDANDYFGLTVTKVDDVPHVFGDVAVVKQGTHKITVSECADSRYQTDETGLIQCSVVDFLINFYGGKMYRFIAPYKVNVYAIGGSLEQTIDVSGNVFYPPPF